MPSGAHSGVDGCEATVLYSSDLLHAESYQALCPHSFIPRDQFREVAEIEIRKSMI